MFNDVQWVQLFNDDNVKVKRNTHVSLFGITIHTAMCKKAKTVYELYVIYFKFKSRPIEILRSLDQLNNDRNVKVKILYSNLYI